LFGKLALSLLSPRAMSFFAAALRAQPTVGSFLAVKKLVKVHRPADGPMELASSAQERSPAGLP
jgi:hypothetical protein